MVYSPQKVPLKYEKLETKTRNGELDFSKTQEEAKLPTSSSQNEYSKTLSISTLNEHCSVGHESSSITVLNTSDLSPTSLNLQNLDTELSREYRGAIERNLRMLQRKVIPIQTKQKLEAAGM